MKTILSLLILLMFVPAWATAQSLVYEGTEGVGKGKHIVFIANDHEYRSEQTCPLLAKILAKHHGFRCTVLFGVDERGMIKAGANDLPGLDALKSADLLVFFTRFMKLPDDQVDMLVDYFERGGPTVGIRTSTHCFNNQPGKWAKLNFNYGKEDYRGGLGEQVYGNTWNRERGQSHYGSNHRMGSSIMPATGAESHPILTGVKKIHAYSGGYKSQLPEDATALLKLQVLNTFEPSEDLNSEKEIVNAGWAREAYVAPSGQTKKSRVVYTSFGASEDMLDSNGRRFMINACLWAAGMEKDIADDLDVSIVGEYTPSPYSSGVLFYENVKPMQLADFESSIMPADAPVAGLSDPNQAWRANNALKVRPEMMKKLQQTYPMAGVAKRPQQGKKKKGKQNQAKQDQAKQKQDTHAADK